MTGVAGASHRLEMLRQERLNSNDRDHRKKLFEEMRLMVSEIENAIDSNDVHKLNAKIHLLSAEGDELTGGLTMEFAQMNARAEMGIRIEEFAKVARKRLVDLWDDWGKRMEACIAEATILCHPLLLADAITAKTTVFQAVLMTQRMQSWVTNTLWEPPEAQIRTMMKLVGQALNIYKRAKNTEGETRTKLFLADLFDLLGNGLVSKNLAEGAFVIARAMGYFRLESHALEYIEGFTNFKRFQKEVELKRGVDLDFRTAEESDDDVRAIARFTLKTLNLPSERLPFLQRDAESCRMIARERLDFCRYINMIQELDHTLSHETCYAIDPPRGCICEKFKYESRIRHKDAATVITVFKITNCEGCKSRSPKGLYKHYNKN